MPRLIKTMNTQPNKSKKTYTAPVLVQKGSIKKITLKMGSMADGIMMTKSM